MESTYDFSTLCSANEVLDSFENFELMTEREVLQGQCTTRPQI